MDESLILWFIVLKYLRQQTEGVSPVMFFLAVAGNTLYGASVSIVSLMCFISPLIEQYKLHKQG